MFSTLRPAVEEEEREQCQAHEENNKALLNGKEEICFIGIKLKRDDETVRESSRWQYLMLERITYKT